MDNKELKSSTDVPTENIDEQITIVGEQADEIIKETEEALGDTQVVDIKKIKEQLAKNTENQVEEHPSESSDTNNEPDNPKTPEYFDDEDDFTQPDTDTSTENTKEELSPITDDDTRPVQGTQKTSLWERIDIQRFFTPRVKRILLVFICVVALLFICGYIVCLNNLPADVIGPNIYIEDINVSGMTYDNALKKINKTTLFDDQIISLYHKGHRYEIEGSKIGLVASPEETVRKAFDYGKKGSDFKNAFLLLRLHLGKHTIVPVAQIDEEKLNEQLQKFGTQCYGELQEHNIVVQADGLTYIGPGKTGFDKNVEAACKEVIKSLENDRFKNIWVTLSSCSPKNLTMEMFDAAVYCDPVDSHFRYEGDEVIVVEESIGRYINKEEAAPLIKQVHEGGNPVYVPWYASEPSLRKSDLEPKLFNSTMGSFSTYYGGTANRNANVARAADLLNGAVIPPGQTFSFNDRVGPRTIANGFYTAPEYQNGETVQGIGGGTCQVSTTLYCAVLYAGLDIVSRTNHMFAVSYAPLGQDATVAYGSVDFKFKNNSEYPIKISTGLKGGTITVNIIGTAWEPEKTVKISNSVSRGTGTSVSSKRYFYSNGELIKTEQLPSSYYKPHNEDTQQSNNTTQSNSANSNQSSTTTQTQSNATQNEVSQSNSDNQNNAEQTNSGEDSSSSAQAQ